MEHPAPNDSEVTLMISDDFSRVGSVVNSYFDGNIYRYEILTSLNFNTFSDSVTINDVPQQYVILK